MTTLFLFLCVLNLQADGTNVADEVQLLREQNQILQTQLQKQGNALDALTKKVEALEAASTSRENSDPENAPPTKGGLNFGKVNLGAEGGVAFFDTGANGFAPHGEFRVDEARLFLEAPIWDEVYFYSDLDLATRENTGLSAQLGELYLDAQDVSKIWGADNLLNVRAGRMFIPFGEEYLSRYAMENPLISHSLADFWGIDPGVEIYGAWKKLSYVLAVQNGGIDGVQDFTGDKSVTARIGFDPVRWLHLSVSAMRTGDLSVQQDSLSALWFGNGFFRSIGSAATTKFNVNLVEGNITARWKSGRVSAAGGFAHYVDNDPMANNARDIYYYSIEAQQNLPKKFYAAARFSQILAPGGYPVAGFGNFNDYFYDSLTTQIWRLSLGLGYRFSDRLSLKAEYSLERGSEMDGEKRDSENFLATEAAFKF